MSQMSIEDEVLLENEEELNELEYFGDEEKPIFEAEVMDESRPPERSTP